MGTSRKREYVRASDLITSFVSGRSKLKLENGEIVEFATLPPATKQRFSLEHLMRTEDGYVEQQLSNDVRDNVRRKVKP